MIFFKLYSFRSEISNPRSEILLIVSTYSGTTVDAPCRTMGRCAHGFLLLLLQGFIKCKLPQTEGNPLYSNFGREFTPRLALFLLRIFHLLPKVLMRFLKIELSGGVPENICTFLQQAGFFFRQRWHRSCQQAHSRRFRLSFTAPVRIQFKTVTAFNQYCVI